ncbi:MAG: leucine-rich repeat domain-containing protein [Ruminococcus sp.]|nr:leucine-rich repeat domain-containing protein [Ruminococcus sp.]
MKRQLISSVLALSLALGGAAALPEGVFTVQSGITASAETYGDFEYAVEEDGTVTITIYTGSGTSAEIPSKIVGKTVKTIGRLAFVDNTAIKTVKLPDTVEAIGQSAFVGCSALEKLELSENLASIGAYALIDCTSLKSLYIPKSVKQIDDQGVGYYTKIDESNSENNKTVVLDGFTILCEKGSYAETYAKDNGISCEYGKEAKSAVSLKEAKVTLEKTEYVYNSKVRKPAVTVKLDGAALKKSTDYTVSYKNNTKVGTATVTVKGKGSYTGTVTKTFKINPKATSISKLTSPKTKQLKVTYKKVSGVTGYQVTYSTSKKFTKAATKTAAVKGAAKTSKTIKSLKKGKTYYIKVRSYKTVSGKKYYSSYTKVKKIKVK